MCTGRQNIYLVVASSQVSIVVNLGKLQTANIDPNSSPLHNTWMREASMNANESVGIGFEQRGLVRALVKGIVQHLQAKLD